MTKLDRLNKLSISTHPTKFIDQTASILSIATAGLFAGQLKDIDHLHFPRVDYIELQRLMQTEILNYSTYEEKPVGELFRMLETYLRSDIYLATLGWRKRHDHQLVFTWSERAGIPFAAYRRYLHSEHRFVTMFQCWSERQEFVITKLDLFPAMDDIIVHCASMKENFIRLGAPEEKIKVIHYSIDQTFFSPLDYVDQEKRMIMSIGEPRSRDYASLFRAVDGLPVRLHLPAYGHWYAREKNNSLSEHIPENVSLTQHLSQIKLRELYARSQFVVLPVRNLVYSAGATAALEAASMARAVIAFRSQGIQDYILDGETGLLVQPGDIDAMRNAIQFLLENPGEAKRLGENARQRILENLNLETYVKNIADLLMNQ